jgi:hypothetical protein
MTTTPPIEKCRCASKTHGHKPGKCTNLATEPESLGKSCCDKTSEELRDKRSTRSPAARLGQPGFASQQELAATNQCNSPKVAVPWPNIQESRDFVWYDFRPQKPGCGGASRISLSLRLLADCDNGRVWLSPSIQPAIGSGVPKLPFPQMGPTQLIVSGLQGRTTWTPRPFFSSLSLFC